MKSPEEGTVLGDTYILRQPIGEGGMGTVWTAQHQRLPKQVAVKLLNPAPSGTSAELQEQDHARFRREAETAARLSHPNLLTISDYNIHEGIFPYLVMPLLVGETLGERLRGGALTIAVVKRYVRQLADGLEAAHKEGVIHRDLKPSNVFICAESPEAMEYDHLKILDFGTTKLLHSQSIQTGRSVLIGTPQYMAPEQANAQSSAVGAHTDQFALAALAYEMLTGQAPFGSGHPAQVLYRIVHEEPPALPETIPPGPRNAIGRALSKRPQDRYESVSAFARAFAGAEQLPKRGRSLRIAVNMNDTETPPTEESVEGVRRTSPPSAFPPEATASRLGWALVLLSLAGGAFWYTQSPTPSSHTPASLPAATTPPESAHLESISRASPAPTVPPPTKTSLSLPRREGSLALRRGRQQLTAPPTTTVPEPEPASAEASPTARRRVSQAIPPKALEDAQAADRALQAGQTTRALHLAHRSLRAARNPPATSVLARAYCRLQDLGNARAALRRLPRSYRAAVVRACTEAGLNLR